jgi:dTDP-4-amino-4,6-dideoxy-D-galactose acyltransferase
MMEIKSPNEAVSFYELKWDTEFFGVSSAKAILHMPLSLSEWKNLKERFVDFEFISIENRNSNSINSHLIGKETSAILADTNIQFTKTIESLDAMPLNVLVQNRLERNDSIIEISEFQYSKFTEDQELSKRRGGQVYRQWLINSFDREDKYFVLYKDDYNNVTGYLLHSYSADACTVELIAVSNEVKKSGIGTSLFRALEYSAFERGIYKIKVGTQIKNLSAINFYHKVGCKQVGCHQVFHLWNLQTRLNLQGQGDIN